MPLLSEDILMEFLQTYRDSAEAELFNSQKEISLARQAFNAGKKLFDHNTEDVSYAFYDDIKKAIKNAYTEKDYEGWSNLLTVAGDAGFTTLSKSSNQSSLGDTALAIVGIIHKEMNRVLRENKSSTPSEAKDLLHAQNIKKATDREVARKKKRLLCTSYSLDKDVSRDNPRSNNAQLEMYFQQGSLYKIEKDQRSLHYLGFHTHESLRYNTKKKNNFIKPPKNLFPIKSFYNVAEEAKYAVNPEKVEVLNYDLPLRLQAELWPAIHLRNCRANLKKISDDNIAIETFISQAEKSRESSEKEKDDSQSVKTSTAGTPMGEPDPLTFDAMPKKEDDNDTIERQRSFNESSDNKTIPKTPVASFSEPQTSHFESTHEIESKTEEDELPEGIEHTVLDTSSSLQSPAEQNTASVAAGPLSLLSSLSSSSVDIFNRLHQTIHPSSIPSTPPPTEPGSSNSPVIDPMNEGEFFKAKKRKNKKKLKPTTEDSNLYEPRSFRN